MSQPANPKFTKRMRLCVVGNLLGRNPGYVTSQGQILADLLSEEGHEVISCSSKINRVLRLADIVFTVILQRKNFDVLILEVYSGLNILMSETASFIGRILGLRMIFVLHGGNLPDFSRRYPRWTKRVLARADVLVAPSPYLIKGLQSLGLPIRMVRNVVEIDEYPCKVRSRIAPKLVWMRSFHALYNPQMAIKVLASVRNSYPDATLVMAGLDKGLEPEIKTMVAEMGLADSVRFPGFLNHEAKIEEFSRAEIYINTNHIDNMPVAVIEACASGLPVIATDVGGLPDLIEDGTNGILVPDGDVDAMADAVNTLLIDSQLTEKLSTNGRKLAELSSWESVRTCWDEIFAEIMETTPQKEVLNSGTFLTSTE